MKQEEKINKFSCLENPAHSKLNFSIKQAATHINLKICNIDAPNIIGVEEIMLGETTRNTTLICSSDYAQILRIKSQFIIPKLTKFTLKEFLRYARTK